jgi:hypothetical protein
MPFRGHYSNRFCHVCGLHLLAAALVKGSTEEAPTDLQSGRCAVLSNGTGY